MDSNIVDKIKSTVTNILDSSDIDSVTEQQVRQLASQQLNLDLSDLPQKILVRQIIESFLLAIPDSPQDDVVLPTAIDGFHNDTQTTVAEEQDIKPVIKEIFPDSCRVICKVVNCSLCPSFVFSYCNFKFVYIYFLILFCSF